MAGIYIHIPFCRKACHYCDFHFSTSLAYVHRMTECLLEDIRLQSPAWKEHQFNTVYFGGGTPSVLSELQLEQLMAGLHEHFAIEPDAEVSFEVNPDDVTPLSLDSWRRAGINRLSIGVQTFHQGLLDAMNRSHDARQAHTAIRLAREAGFSSISADLIYGQPNQDLKRWQSDVEAMIKHQPEHISAYCLTVEHGTALNHFVRDGSVVIPPDQHIEAQYGLLCTLLGDAGYEHYEVSNWAKPGCHSRHNSAYWSREPYVGIGPSAHGFIGNQRYWNVAGNGAYMKALESGHRKVEEERLTERDGINEAIMTGLRTAQGLRLALLDALSESQQASIQDMLRAWEASGSGRFSNGHFQLTEAAMLQGDRMASDLFILEE